MMTRKEKYSIIAGLFGNALEWYDFLLYASFAPIFAVLFFPSKVPFVSLLATFSLFAIGFIMRPIGGMLLGHYADYWGRRKALICSMSIMTVSTTLIGLTPDFNSLGILAPILFSLLRLIQGLAVGGELPGSTTYLIEHKWGNRRGFAGSLVLSSAFLGIFAGAFIASICSFIFSSDNLLHWGWRCPYLVGGILGVFGIYLRLQSDESPAFSQEKLPTDIPIKIILSKFKTPLFLAIILTSILALGNYVLIAYVTTFLVKSEGFMLHDTLLINLIAISALTLLIPIMGFMSDTFGRKPIFLMGLIPFLLLIFPIFWLLSSGNWWNILWSELLLALILAPINATVPTMLAEMFPTNIRASGVSLSYNVAQAVFGGTLPLIALTLIEFTGNKFAPAWYMFLWALTVIIISCYVKESYKKEFI